MEIGHEGKPVEPHPTLPVAAGPSARSSAPQARPPRPTLSFDPPVEHCFEGLVGRSPGMRRLFDQISIVAGRFRIAALEGEDGTGKTSIARVLHRLSPAASRPFYLCPAASFLNPRAADPAANWDTQIVDSAQAGTLFLDRAHELDPLQQRRLFRFLLWLEHQQIQRSARGPRNLVVSSSIPLRRLVVADTFRGDVCARLGAIRLPVPALRERREDIPILAQAFINRFVHTCAKPVRGLGQGTLTTLLRYSWPGNVRELESVIVAAALSTESEWIRPIDLPVLPSPAVLPASRPVSSPSADLPEDFTLDGAVRRQIERALRETQGNKLRAAALLGISRSTLYRMLASATPSVLSR